MTATIIDRATGARRVVEEANIDVPSGSVVSLPYTPEQVASFAREGNDLLVTLRNGQVVRVKHFYQQAAGDAENQLVLDHQGEGAWLGHHTQGLADFTFSETHAFDALLGSGLAAGGGGLTLPLAGLAVLGGGAAVAAGGGSGNGAEPAQPVSPPVADTTAPTAPSAKIDASGTKITGTGEAGATVKAYAPDGTTVLGSAVVQSDGSYSLTIAAKTNGEDLTVKQSDAAGNVSTATALEAPDSTAPVAPSGQINSSGTVITGTGEPGSTVKIYANNGTTLLGSGTVGSNGSYSVTIPAQTNGETVKVTQTDSGGNNSPVTTVTAPDTTVPAAPGASVNTAGTTVSGTGEAGATVTVYGSDGTSVLGKAVVQPDGSYSVTIPAQNNGEHLTVTQTDAAGNHSPTTPIIASDTTPPAKPGATIDSGGTTITGTGEKGATVTVYGPDGTTVLGSGTVQPDGSYSVTIPPQSNGEHLTVTQTDAAQNVSAATPLTAPDTTTPVAPGASLNAAGTTVSGSGEAGAIVTVYGPDGTTVLGTATVQPDGSYSVTIPAQSNGEHLTVTQSDAAGHVSPAASVIANDTTPPAAPEVHIDISGATVTGTGEVGAVVTVYGPDGTTVLGSGTVQPDGSYSVTILAQNNGEHLTVTLTDAAQNTSAAGAVTAPDTMPPAPPSVVIDSNGTTVSGSGEAGTTVTVYGPDGVTALGSGTVQPDGTYSVSIPAQTNGEQVSVTLTDAGQNISPATTVTAPDTTPPGQPSATIDSNGTVVTGSGEAGATVTVYAADGVTPLGLATVQGDGSYSVLIPPQTNGEQLTVTLTDTASNVSVATTLNAPDITPPAPPIAAIDGGGTTVTGTAEAGATVTVYGPDGTTVLGSTTAQLDGSYSVTIPAQTNGEHLTVTQTDMASNVSPPTLFDAPDITAPGAPSVFIDSAGSTVTGTGEIGAIVTVYGPDGVTPLGSGTVQPDGSYSVTIPAQANGQHLTVTLTDAAQNISVAGSVTAPDTTPPAAPSVAIDGSGTTVTGSGEVGATITVYGPDGVTPLGTGTVQPDGNYSVTIPAQTNGEHLTVTQTDAGPNTSPAGSVTAPDTTPPVAPSVNIDSSGTTVTGFGEIGATVTVYGPDGITPLGTGTVQPDGSYSVTIPAQTNGEHLTVTQTDAALHESPAAPIDAPDTTVPQPPSVLIDSAGATVTGTGEAGTTVTVYGPDGTSVIGTGTVQPDGTYSVTIPAQTNGEHLTVTLTDGGMNTSPAGSVTAPDTTLPAPPLAGIDAGGTIVTGSGEVGATVTVYGPDGVTPLGSSTVQPDGTYSVIITAQTNGEHLTVTQTDSAMNVSPATPVEAPDFTPPAAPSVNIDSVGITVSGNGEVGATVIVYGPDGMTILGSATVQSDGSYSVTIPAQTNGEHLTVTQTDIAQNISPAGTVTAPDTTTPVAPTADIDGSGTTVSGSGEIGATITVYGPDGVTPLGTGTVQPDGTYSVTITALTNGEHLTVTQTDAALHESPATPLDAPDTTPPAAPGVAIDGAGSTVSGTGEVGSMVTVYGPDGSTVLGTGTVQADGNYSVLIPAQTNGEHLTVTLTDAALNTSSPGTVTAPDTTPPAAPLAVIDAAGSVVSGSGEIGATVHVYAPDGTTELGSGIVQSDGSYSITIAAQTAGEHLTVMQSDAAGNPSPSTALTAPFFTVDAVNDFGSVDLTIVPFTHRTEGSDTAVIVIDVVGVTQTLFDSAPRTTFTVGATETADATLTVSVSNLVGVLDGAYAQVQVSDGAGGWVNASSVGNNGFIDLLYLNGTSASLTLSDLPPGEYRILGMATGIEALTVVTVTASVDYYDPTIIGSYDPQTIASDVLSNDLLGSTVTVVNGVSIDTDDTVVHGTYGDLTIDPDGNYSYTPYAIGSAIGQVDSFTYTVTGVNNTSDSATLYIDINSPGQGLTFTDPTQPATTTMSAVDDSGSTLINTAYLVDTFPSGAPSDHQETSITTDLINGTTEQATSNFTVEANQTATVRLMVSAPDVAAQADTLVVTITGDNGYINTLTGTANLLALQLQVDQVLSDLAAGNYNVTAEYMRPGGSLAGANLTLAYTTDSITHLDSYVVTSSDVATGNVLTDDTLGSSYTKLMVDTGGGFVEVSDGTTLIGNFGTLTINHDGSYSYQYTSDAAGIGSVDDFVYQLEYPNGTVDSATLEITIDNGSGPYPAPVALMSLFSFSAPTVEGLLPPDSGSGSTTDTSGGSDTTGTGDSSLLMVTSVDDDTSNHALTMLV